MPLTGFQPAIGAPGSSPGPIGEHVVHHFEQRWIHVGLLTWRYWAILREWRPRDDVWRGMMAQLSDDELIVEFSRIDPWTDGDLERWDALAAEMARRDINLEWQAAA
jgi:hypothetical protein